MDEQIQTNDETFHGTDNRFAGGESVLLNDEAFAERRITDAY